MSKKKNGKISGEAQSYRGEKVCLICGKDFDVVGSYGTAVCPKCTEKYKIKPRVGRNKYPCDHQPICKKCAHRTKLTDKHYICDCLEHTGHIRDLKGDEEHCRTFEPKSKKKKQNIPLYN